MNVGSVCSGVVIAAVIFATGMKAGFSIEHLARVKDEVSALVQVNEEQRNTITAMDQRYRDITAEVDRYAAENTRLSKLAQANKEKVNYAIDKSKGWRDTAVPSDVADGLRAYSANGGAAEAGEGSRATGINVQDSGNTAVRVHDKR